VVGDTNPARRKSFPVCSQSELSDQSYSIRDTHLYLFYTRRKKKVFCGNFSGDFPEKLPLAGQTIDKQPTRNQTLYEKA